MERFDCRWTLVVALLVWAALPAWAADTGPVAARARLRRTALLALDSPESWLTENGRTVVTLVPTAGGAR